MDEFTSLCSGMELPKDTVPTRIQVLPSGSIRGRDGRAFFAGDAAAIIAASRQGVDLPIDYEHQVDDPTKRRNGPIPAAGWIKSLHAQADGIWANVEWTETAAQMLRNREYRFLSPVIVTSGPGAGSVIKRIKGASLVHAPNLDLVALASQEENHMPSQPTEIATIAEAMGLDPEATLQDVLNAIAQTGKPDPAKYVPIEAVADLLTNRNQTVATMSQFEVDAKVETAMRNGYLTPAMKGWATELCTQSPESFDSFVSSSLPMFEAFSKSPFESVNTNARPVKHATGDVTALCAQLGLTPDQLTD